MEAGLGRAVSFGNAYEEGGTQPSVDKKLRGGIVSFERPYLPYIGAPTGVPTASMLLSSDTRVRLAHWTCCASQLKKIEGFFGSLFGKTIENVLR